VLAGGCLSTTFVWLQHQMVVRTVAASVDTGAPRGDLLRDLCAGRVRAGVAFSHLRRSGPPPVTVVPHRGGWTLRGQAPWVTGWGLIDTVLVGARTPEGDVWWGLVPAHQHPALRPERLTLAAVDASSTVTLHLDDIGVGDEDVMAVVAAEEWSTHDRVAFANNGALALGIADRCLQLLGEGVDSLARDVAAGWERLDAIANRPEHVDEAPRLRAELSELALRCSAALVAANAGMAISRDRHPQRLAREALFCLVQGQDPRMRSAEIELLSRTGPATASGSADRGSSAHIPRW
jgi:alkylation response protein AidB-like acyl-CoA dehydrogenase